MRTRALSAPVKRRKHTAPRNIEQIGKARTDYPRATQSKTKQQKATLQKSTPPPNPAQATWLSCLASNTNIFFFFTVFTFVRRICTCISSNLENYSSFYFVFFGPPEGQSFFYKNDIKHGRSS